MTEVLAVSIPDAARMAGVSPMTLRRAIEAGQLPRHYPTRNPVILVDDLKAWLSATPTEKRPA